MKQALQGVCLAVVLAFGAVWVFGSREPAPLTAQFDQARFGDGVQVYFESTEAQFDDITRGVEKRVIWRDGFKEQRTPVSILYVHGFSATSEEIRPVPDLLAERIGANLVYTRLAGHGRSGDALGDATVADWMTDMAEGLAAARRVGERVVVLSTSTGGTLTAAAMLDPKMAEDVAALVFVSPNFRINETADFMLTWPGARTWLPWLIGPTRSFVPENEAQATYWTVEYPATALLPMAAIVREVSDQDFSAMEIPALFWFSRDDQVVRAEATEAFADEWGGPVRVNHVTTGPGDDPASHVVTGAIMSPGQVDYSVREIEAWLRDVLD